MTMETQRQAPAGATDAAAEAATLLDEILADVVAAGKDTTALSRDHRAAMLTGLARRLGLNPLSNAVMFLKTNGRETLYVTKQGTDQIAAREKLCRETIKGPEVIEIEKRRVVFCQVRATHPDGRSEVSTATLLLTDPVNDLMKCETKAKRRATLSVCGLGLLAEDEIETIPGARTVPADVLAAPIVVAPPLMPANPINALGIEHPQSHVARREVTHAIHPTTGAVVQGDDTERLTPAGDPAQDSFVEAVDAIELPGEAVAVWMRHRGAILAMGDEDQKSARKYLAARVAAVGKMTHKAAAQWCAKAIAEEDARRAAEGGSDHAAA
jgi:hypothetical protein